jgi:hypothetical protein
MVGEQCTTPPHWEGVSIHYSFSRRLLTETGIGLNPKALMICAWVLLLTINFQGCSFVREVRMT